MAEQLTVITRSAAETEGLGRALGELVRLGDVLALDGPLGAGKTNLVRGLAAGMGHDPRLVFSPTFVIVNEYASGARTPLFHVDAYRLSGPEDLESVGWDRVLDGTGVIAVEWAGRLGGQGLAGAISTAWVTITPLGADERSIALSVPAGWALRAEWPALLSLAEPRTNKPTRCPVCDGPVAAGSEHWPFDTLRCRSADLDRWFTGQYKLSREIRAEDEGEAGV